MKNLFSVCQFVQRILLNKIPICAIRYRRRRANYILHIYPILNSEFLFCLYVKCRLLMGFRKYLLNAILSVIENFLIKYLDLNNLRYFHRRRETPAKQILLDHLAEKIVDIFWRTPENINETRRYIIFCAGGCTYSIRARLFGFQFDYRCYRLIPVKYRPIPIDYYR